MHGRQPLRDHTPRSGEGRPFCRARSEGAIPSVTGAIALALWSGAHPSPSHWKDALEWRASVVVPAYQRLPRVAAAATWLQHQELVLWRKAVRAQSSLARAARPLLFWSVGAEAAQLARTASCGQLTSCRCQPTDPLLALAWNRSDALATRRPRPFRRRPGP